MARVNLRAAFMSGLGSPVSAQHVFTNRSDEVAAFERALVALDAELDAAEVSPVVDRVRGRRNVLAFYGVGGIGKTTLSHELERRLVGDTQANRRDVAAVRVDLAEDGATDLEALLLRVRAGLGRLGRRWPAFDLALASYWARAHPGEALQEFLDASPTVRRVARSVGLGEQLAESLQLVAPTDLGGLPGLAHRAALGAYRAIRDRAREGRLLAECDLFAELVGADADYEALSYFPYLLAWDLDRLPGRDDQRPRACVFLDTFEVLAGQADQAAERFVQRLMYLMPNVLFVVTGRNRIDWADNNARGELDFIGQARWPNLHYSNDTAEPRQHLVGYLSASDADAYLREALIRDGEPAMPADVRRRIIDGGQGLPLYLDLSVSHFVELLARGGDPSPEDFGGSFTAVATRSIRDLSRDERELVRTAALMDRFDADLLRAGQPSLTDGVVARFLRRPFLVRDDAYGLPYALHLALRGAIHEADEAMPDGWSDQDRRDVAVRLLKRLGERAEAADRATTVQALDAGLKLAATYGAFDDWLPRATHRLVEAGQWASAGSWLPAPGTDDRVTATDAEEPGSAAGLSALRATVEGVVLRRTGRAPDAVAVLEGAGADLPAGDVTGQLARLHLAHALRNTGDYRRAAEAYRSLVGGEFDNVARYWLSDHDFLNGRFRAALSGLEADAAATPAEEGERLRLIGHIQRVNARFDAAADAYREAVALARAEGLVAAEAKALTNLAQTSCWAGGTDAVADVAGPARELLDLVPNPVELVKLAAAEAVADALAGDTAGSAEAIAEARRLADGIGYRGGHNLADVADALLAALSGDDHRARRALVALEERTRQSGGNIYWVPITAAWLDGPDAAAHAHTTIDWLDGPGPTLARWAAILVPAPR